MPLIYPVRVEEQLTVTGTNNITTGSTPVAGAQTFANACAVGDSFPLYIFDTTTSPITIEQSIGTYSAANTITRTALPGQALTSFSGNSCYVLIGTNPYSNGLGANVDPATYNWMGNALLTVYTAGALATFGPGGYPAFFPFLVPVGGKVSAFTVVVSTASTTAGSGALAVLMAPTTGRSSASWTTLIDFTATTQIDLTTAGTQTISNFTPTLLEPGLYLLQILQNSTGANGGLMAAGNQLNTSMGLALTTAYGLQLHKLIMEGAASSALVSPFSPSTQLPNQAETGVPLILLGMS